MADMVMWLRTCKFDRISMHTPFDDCVHVDLGEFCNQLEALNLDATVDGMFGPMGISELQWFRRELWFQDSSLKLVMGNLLNLAGTLHKRVGAVNPMYAHISDLAAQRELIASTDPFEAENEMVLMPMWMDLHWCAAVFNYKDWTIRLLDPFQTRNNYSSMAKTLKKLLPATVRKFKWSRVSSPYQEDTNNCGLYCSIFFESQVRGCPMPDIRRRAINYLRFRYIFKECVG